MYVNSNNLKKLLIDRKVKVAGISCGMLAKMTNGEHSGVNVLENLSNVLVCDITSIGSYEPERL